MKRLTLSALVGVLAIMGACSRQAADSEAKPPVGAVASAAASTGQPAHAAEIAWFPGSVDAALAEAQAKNKPVFLFWHAAWCPYCQDLKASVFKRPDVVAKLGF